MEREELGELRFERAHLVFEEFDVPQDLREVGVDFAAEQLAQVGEVLA